MQGILICNIFLFKFILVRYICHTRDDIINSFEKKIWNVLKKLKFLVFFLKNRVRWKFTTVFGLEKTALDRIPLYRRTALKEECLYLNFREYFNVGCRSIFIFHNEIKYQMSLPNWRYVSDSEMSIFNSAILVSYRWNS